MKRVLTTLLVIITLIVLTGCSHTVNSSTHKTLFRELKENNIISNDLTEFDQTEHCSRTFGACGCDYTYIYKNSAGKLISIEYFKGGYNYDYEIIICYDLLENEYYTGPSQSNKGDYDYDDCYHSTDNKYVISPNGTCERYYVNKDNKKYEFIKE